MDGANDGTVDVLVGYLVTHADGYEARIGPDRMRADLYAASQPGDDRADVRETPCGAPGRRRRGERRRGNG